MPKQSRHDRALPTAVAAIILGCLCTIGAHRWIVRHSYPNMRCVRGTYELNNLLGVAPEPTLVPEEWEWNDPPSAAFLRAAIAHAEPFVRDKSKQYYIWIVPFAGPPSPWHGWPIVTQVPTSTLWVEEWDDRRNHEIELTPDGGLDPMRYWGLIGNWAFYTATSFLVIWFGKPSDSDMTLPKRSRFQHIAKYAGAVVSVLILMITLESTGNHFSTMITTPWLVRWNNEIVSLHDGIIEIAAERPGEQVRVYLVIPFLLVAIPTAFLWARPRRRIPPGYCQTCGYNLTGNVSGVCPECGTAVECPAETEISASEPGNRSSG